MKVVEFILDLGSKFSETVQDVAPIILLIAFFQIIVIKKSIPNLPKVFMGLIFVIIGLTFFLMGLEKALFPIGNIMATQLSEPEFVKQSYNGELTWQAYYWIYIFAMLIGFSTTIAEPALKAVAIKASEVSGGVISETGLRIIVAVGAGLALSIGAFRIVTGTPLHYYLLVCYLIVIIQTIFAPKDLVALAYDSGGVTTSTVTVPIVAAIGIGLSSVVPGRNPALDGFGLIALVCMFPIITVLAYAQFMEIISKLKKRKTR
ncbi:MAG: DUF1538 domain-containing protein [Flavobacteriales bacterium]